LGWPSESKLRNRGSWRHFLLLVIPVIGAAALGASAAAQTCQTAADIDPPTRTALESAAQRYFQMAAQGDSASLKQNSIGAVAANFTGIEAAVKENQPAFGGAKATIRPPFLLVAEGADPLPRAEFLCGVFGKLGQTKDSAEFVLSNLPPGKYGVAILDIKINDVKSTPAMTLTLILQQIGSDWKLAGFFPRSSEAAGHDAAWFTDRAREFKAKSQTHNAWLYYREAVFLSAPVDIMSTQSTDRLYEEIEKIQPADMPANGNPTDLTVAGKTYHLTALFLLAVGNDLEVVVKYQSPDISDTAHTFQENTAVIKTLVAKYPEFREAFSGVVARAVDPSGRDYGTLLAMKDIK
jgi:hypothetical protein